MLYFTLFQIPVRIMPWFWITMAIIGGGLGSRQIDSPNAILQLLLFIIAGFISVLVHEFGHGLVAKAFGKRVEIVLEAFGGYAAYSGGSALGRGKRILISLAGPVFQILLGVVILFVSSKFPEISNAFYFLEQLYKISFFWAAINLLPILPLDGGHILESALGPQRIKLTLMISIVVAICAGLCVFLAGGSPLFAIFLGMYAYQSYQALKSLR